jgi:hypothetical protein
LISSCQANGSATEVIPNGAIIYKWATYTVSMGSEAFFGLYKTHPIASMHQ